MMSCHYCSNGAIYRVDNDAYHKLACRQHLRRAVALLLGSDVTESVAVCLIG